MVQSCYWYFHFVVQDCHYLFSIFLVQNCLCNIFIFWFKYSIFFFSFSRLKLLFSIFSHPSILEIIFPLDYYDESRCSLFAWKGYVFWVYYFLSSFSYFFYFSKYYFTTWCRTWTHINWKTAILFKPTLTSIMPLSWITSVAYLFGVVRWFQPMAIIADA